MRIPIIRPRLDHATEVEDEHAPFGFRWNIPFDMTSTTSHILTVYRDQFALHA